MGANVHLAGAPRKGRLSQGPRSQKAREGRLRGAEALKKDTDARQFMKAVKIQEVDRKFPLLPQNYEYKPRVAMDRTSDEYKARQRDSWTYAASRLFKRLGLSTGSLVSPPPTLGETRGLTSSWGAKRKVSHRRRGRL